ncbi:MAG TPA: thiamine pyrophosphate-dependent enzyme, partial [Acetobacteraceae bacterium]|nr:thiamine pyrophosphate-dependent enzyme [Acetobacteraceae bacterium]
HVLLALELPTPDGGAAVQRYFRLMAGHAVDVASGRPAGPVHLNFPFREPLVPLAPIGAPACPTPEGHPFVAPGPAGREPAPEQTAAVADLLRRARRGLIVCGGQDDPAFPAALVQLAVRAQFPVLADPLSGVRCGPHAADIVVDSYDAFLRDAALAETMQPDLVLRFGAAPTSKPLLQYLERHAKCPQLLIADGWWSDPALIAAAALDGDPTACCRRLLDMLAGHRPVASALAWSRRWEQADAVSRAVLADGAAGFAEPFEGRVFGELAHLLPDDSVLFVGNSMPVRDLETFFPRGRRRVRFLANRGASGIDGVVSTALGAAAGGRSAVLVIGDLSFYHDMNGLLAARQHHLDLTIVLINNDGGGIFSFLPQAGQVEHFERLFGTPHGLEFAPVAALYGARYTLSQSWAHFAAAVQEGIEQGGLHIVEVRTEREQNVRQHRALWQHVAEALRQA